MKKMDFGQSLTILANIGVIFGIGFLAIEIRDSANHASNEALQTSVAQFVDWHHQIASDPALAQIYSAGRKDYSGLSEIEQQRFDALMRALFHSVAVFIDSRAAVIVADLAPLCERTGEGYFQELLEQPGFRQWLSTVDRRALPNRMFRILEDIDQECGRDSSGNE